MKIIQSYWTGPTRKGNNEDKENRYNGGYKNALDQYVGFALSCLRFKEYYENVELYTDKAGYELLIEKLQLPYTRVHVCLDDLNHVPPLLWAMPKIYTYSLQNEPFIHADNDVFIWERFPEKIEQAPLLAQHEEGNEFYKIAFKFVLQNTKHHPDVLLQHNPDEGIKSINAGIFGGNDIAFIKEYTQQALTFLEKNISNLAASEKSGQANIIIEQFLFHALAAARQKNITYLLDGVQEDYSDLGLFHLVPFAQKFIHLVGKAKSHPLISNMIHNHLRMEFPSYYEHIMKVAKDEIKVSVNTPTKNDHFEKTKQLIRHFSGEDKELTSVEEISAAIEELSTSGLPEKQINFAQQLFRFEEAKYGLLVNPYNSNYKFENFCKAKALASESSDEEILSTKFTLSDDVKIILCDYDVDSIISVTNWIDTLPATLHALPPDEHIFLIERGEQGEILVTPLFDGEQLLYYFSVDPISGLEIVDFLVEDKSNQDTIVFYKTILYDITLKALTYGSHIVQYVPSESVNVEEEAIA